MSTENISLRNMKFPEGCPKIEFYKHPTYCELVIYLFTKCNLNCAFCFQEHSADLDMEFINSIPEKALELLRRDFTDQPTIKQQLFRRIRTCNKHNKRAVKSGISGSSG